MTILSLLLTDFIFSYTSANVIETLIIANLLSISLAVWLFDRSPSSHPHYSMRLGSITIEKDLESIFSDTSCKSISKNRADQVTRNGMTKKGDTLSPEHRAKISASLKKRSEEKKAQDERIAKTQKTKLARKKTIKK
jgi:hypothetical protein